MSWKEERDSLIAQTMAFVQSVTGRQEEAVRLDTMFACRHAPRLFCPSSMNWTPSPRRKRCRRSSRSRWRNCRATGQTRPCPAPDRSERDGQRNPRAHRRLPRPSGALQSRARGIFQQDARTAESLARREPAAAAARQIDAALDQPAILSSTGSRYFRNASGFSLIGKCPRPFMMVTSLPGMLFATAIVSSGVQE